MAKILVVDDQDTFLRINAKILQLDGHQVWTAHCGREALDIVRREYPDIVLLDLMMPGMDGYEVSRAIKADPQTAQTVVVIVTASTSYRQALSRQAGVDEYVTKPLLGTELRGLVTRLMKKRGKV
ncbi:MAG: response regulator [Anaerolineae bacterium]|nr:response regulator [Anaerolineae bacterium]